MTQTIRLETEPIFNIHIEFCDGSKPIDYYNLNLKQAMVVLQDWSEEWILIPDEDCELNGNWNWHAHARKRAKEKPIDIEAEDDPEEDVVPIGAEFSEPEE